MAQEIEAALTRAAQRQEILRTKWAEQQRDANDARSIGEIRALVPVVAVAVSVLFPAAAPYAIGASQALSTTADLAIASKTGGGPLSFQGVYKTFAEVQAEHAKYQERAKKLSAAWQEVGVEADGAWDYLTGTADRKELTEFTDKAKAFSQLAREFQASLPKPGQPSTIELAEFEKQDEVLTAILAEISRLREQESEAPWFLQCGLIPLSGTSCDGP